MHDAEILIYRISVSFVFLKGENIMNEIIEKEYVDFQYKIIVDSYKNIKEFKIHKDLNPIIALIKIKRFFSILIIQILYWKEVQMLRHMIC